MSKLLTILVLAIGLTACNDRESFDVVGGAGADGQDGTQLILVQNEDGVTITSSDQPDDTFTVTNGQDGIDGQDGTDGEDGQDGIDGQDGAQGKQGLTGATGAQGKQGVQGVAGANGQDGQDGDSCRIKAVDGGAVIECANGTTVTLRNGKDGVCLLYTSPSPRDRQKSRMPSSA